MFFYSKVKEIKFVVLLADCQKNMGRAVGIIEINLSKFRVGKVSNIIPFQLYQGLKLTF